MENMNIRYSLESLPPPRQFALFSLQWLMLTVPFVIIIGKTVAGLQYPDNPGLQLSYLQRMFFAMGITALTQLFYGHRLPLVIGPAAVLLVGIIAACQTAAPAAVYSSILIGGLAVAIFDRLGILGRISALFTPRIIGVVLLLVAFTMVPTIVSLLAGRAPTPRTLVFTALMLLAVIAGYRLPAGLFKSTLSVWTLLIGTILYHLFAGQPSAAVPQVPLFALWGPLNFQWTFDPALIISFMFCYLALVANDIGSIQTTAQLLSLPDAGQRTSKGLFVTGLGNILAGLSGVVGPVNYSLSTGVILSSSCASRFTLLPAALVMLAMSFIPALINLVTYIPSEVIGVMLFYTMCSQIAGGLGMLSASLRTYSFETGLIIGVPIMAGMIIALLPAHYTATIPALIRPLVTNGFVVGLLLAIIMDHLLAKGNA